jgi:hypothetical protein
MNKLIHALLIIGCCSIGNLSAQLQEIGRIDVGANGSTNIMGVKIGYDGKIWYVDNTQRKVFRLDNDEVIGGDLSGYFRANTTFTQIASGPTDGITSPVDLDFHPTRQNELWVLNQGTESSGGSTSTITDVGGPNQKETFLTDGNAWHFMALATAMAFGENGNWGTSQGILDANRSGGSFTGPTLWSGDMNIYAQVGDPPSSTVNGSHLDMLHQSPYSMGIAHEVDNVYWVFDGFNNSLVRYDFQEPHYPGGFDHDDAIVRRYTEVELEHKGTLPAHMSLDKASGWLFICDTDNSRVLQVNIHTGSADGNLVPAHGEVLAEYSRYTGVTHSVAINSGLQDPVGIDAKNHFLIVSDNATNEIVVYRTQDLTGISTTKSNPTLSFSLYPNPTSGNVFFDVSGLDKTETTTLTVMDLTGRKVYNERFNPNNKNVDLSALSNGIYHVTLSTASQVFTRKLVLAK